MRRFITLFIFSLFFSTQSVNGEELINNTDLGESSYVVDGTVEYYCNTKKSYFAFFADSPKLLKGIKKQIVEIYHLSITSKEDSLGNYMRLGSKKAIRQCGTIKATFESGYYNANIQGELGLMDYPLMSITVDGQKILNKNVLNLCSSSGFRMICPTDFSIQSIEVMKVSKNLYQISLTKAIPIDNGDNFKLENETINVTAK